MSLHSCLKLQKLDKGLLFGRRDNLYAEADKEADGTFLSGSWHAMPELS